MDDIEAKCLRQVAFTGDLRRLVRLFLYDSERARARMDRSGESPVPIKRLIVGANPQLRPHREPPQRLRNTLFGFLFRCPALEDCPGRPRAQARRVRMASS